ncbi:MAG TPA: hypothetical protein DCM73_04185 [Clostridiales bacterium]|nr:hypothetical protein [Clostridiales bacterium]
MDENARINYLSSILKVIRAAGKNTSLHNIPMNCAALVSTNKTKKIEQRFRLVLDYDPCTKQYILPSFLLCAMVLLLSLISYKFIIQQDIIQQPKLVKKKFLKSLLKIHILQLIKTAHTLCMQIIYTGVI